MNNAFIVIINSTSKYGHDVQTATVIHAMDKTRKKILNSLKKYASEIIAKQAHCRPNEELTELMEYINFPEEPRDGELVKDIYDIRAYWTNGVIRLY